MKIRPIEAFLLENDVPVESGIMGKYPLYVPDGFLVLRITGEVGQPVFGFLAWVFPESKTDIRPHEDIIPEKYVLKEEAVRMGTHTTKPVCLLYAPDEVIMEHLAMGFEKGKTIFSCHMDHLHYEYSVCEDDDWTRKLRVMMEQVGSMVIADGHHRTAAYFATQQDREDREGLFSAILSLDQIRIHSYHRYLQVADHNVGTLMEGLRDLFVFQPVTREEVVEWCDQTIHDSQVIYMRHQGRWNRLNLRDENVRCRPGSADIHRFFEKKVLVPFCTHSREPLQKVVDYISGPEWKDFESRAEGGFLILFPPVSRTFLWESTLRGEMMPAKSTWIAPRMPGDVIRTM